MSLEPHSLNDIKKLSLDALVERMDIVRLTADKERYGSHWIEMKGKHDPLPQVKDLMSTFIARQMGEPQKRKLADAAFRFLLQMDMLSVSSGISNAVVYGPNYHDGIWAHPSRCMASAVLDQYQIIASRIALECFFDLLYIADCGERMSGKSKFSTFRKWVVLPENPYKYFVGHIIVAFEFDREHRQKEVHGTSRFAHSLLRLEKPNSEELNISLKLTNVLLSVWRPLIEIMNGIRPNSISVFNSCDDFAEKYFNLHYNPASFDDFVAEILAEKMSNNNSHC
jgi:hypothetical protein